MYKTSTASFQSIGLTVTGVSFSFSELLISFVVTCGFEMWSSLEHIFLPQSGSDLLDHHVGLLLQRWKVREFLRFCWRPLGFFWVLTFGSIQSSPSLEIPSNSSGARGYDWIYTNSQKTVRKRAVIQPESEFSGSGFGLFQSLPRPFRWTKVTEALLCRCLFPFLVFMRLIRCFL